MVGGLSPPRRTLSMGSGGAMARRAAAAATATATDSPRPGLSRSMTMGGERTVKRLRLSRALTVPESTTVLEVCRRMAARRADAALLTDSNALLCGILTDKDIATRVIARELKIDDTPVWKVMTRHPIFVLSDTLAVEALQKMVQGKFRHLPVVDNGEVVAMLDIAKCLYDAIARMERVTEKGKAAIANVPDGDDKFSIVEAFKEQMCRPCLSAIASTDSTVVMVSPGDSVESSGEGSEDAAASMIQRFWDSAMALGPLDDETDTQSQMSEASRSQMMSEAQHDSVAGSEAAYPSVFSFKLQDRRGRMHRFSCEVQSLTPLVTSILRRLGADPDRLPQILYEDEDGDKVVLASDDDLAAAVDHARLAGWKGLRLFLDYSGTTGRRKAVASSSGGAMAVGMSSRDAWAAAYSGVAAGAALVTGIGVMAYLRRSG
ncbi:hypothetical protein PVAP13_8NG253400 [Panicum virgatum]|uniref:Uncharacterized protein n=1 Tax=Panicum virgatum TaxID=38727 RepID=A0A8T0PC37_PANVG|nr:hypothetical protein PVAP13_8NG253400 [Panicum virgatum]